MASIPVKDFFDIFDRLGVIDAVKKKLIAQPDPAAARLVTVLEELSKVCAAMDDELTSYFALFFDDSDKKQLARERAALARFEGGMIGARLSEARGHCGKIWNIYIEYLKPWFGRVLNPTETEQLFVLFRALSEVDSSMVDAINEISRWLTTEAAATFDLVEKGHYADANANIASAIGRARPLRTRIADSMVRIRNLEADFVAMSGVV